MTSRSEVSDLTARIVADLWRDASERVDERSPERTWIALEAAGLTLVGVDSDLGGSGGSLVDACDVLWQLGAGAVPVPVAETGLLGGWALASAGLHVPPGALTFAIANAETTLQPDRTGWRLSTRLTRVPWAVRADHLVVVVPDASGDMVCLVPAPQATIVPGSNLAREPRDLVTIDVSIDDGAVAMLPERSGAEVLHRRGALSRAVLMAGALERVAALSVEYANGRAQFGRSIITFQAVAGLIAQLVGHTAAATTAVRAAVAAGDDAAFVTAVAKQQTSEAASLVAKLAHQVHGAIGMTDEYELGQLTKRLWCWRQEYGSERDWATWIGSLVVDGGAEVLWPLLTSGDMA